LRYPKKTRLPGGEYTTKPTSRHAPLPGTSASIDAIQPCMTPLLPAQGRETAGNRRYNGEYSWRQE
jgi:hypothetical protein